MTLISKVSKGLKMMAFKEHESFRKIHFSAFFHSKALGTKFDLAIKLLNVNPGSSFILSFKN